MNPLAFFKWYRRLRGGYWALRNRWWVKVKRTDDHDEEHRTWQSARGMGISVVILMAATCWYVYAAPPPTTATVSFKWLPDTNDMAGLSTNDYCTNITVVFYQTKNINQPTNQWPVVDSVPVPILLSQGMPGAVWSHQFPVDGKAAFYAIVMTNGNGGSSPFSNLAPGLTGPNAGVIILPLKLQ